MKGAVAHFSSEPKMYSSVILMATSVVCADWCTSDLLRERHDRVQAASTQLMEGGGSTNANISRDLQGTFHSVVCNCFWHLWKHCVY